MIDPCTEYFSLDKNIQKNGHWHKEIELQL